MDQLLQYRQARLFVQSVARITQGTVWDDILVHSDIAYVFARAAEFFWGHLRGAGRLERIRFGELLAPSPWSDYRGSHDRFRAVLATAWALWYGICSKTGSDIALGDTTLLLELHRMSLEFSANRELKGVCDTLASFPILEDVWRHPARYGSSTTMKCLIVTAKALTKVRRARIREASSVGYPLDGASNASATLSLRKDLSVLARITDHNVGKWMNGNIDMGEF